MNQSATVYTPLTLKLYDWWVLKISNEFAWRCPTKKYLLPHFLQHLSSAHLDIGVGSGYYLTHAPHSCLISLMDINSASLNTASARNASRGIQNKIQHDVFDDYPEHIHNKFQSVSMFYLLHCLNGNMAEKGTVISNTKKALTDSGVLYGATILGEGVNHNTFGRKLMNIYNKKGIFSNHSDSEEGLRKILSDNFKNVDVNIRGTVAMFSAQGKK